MAGNFQSWTVFEEKCNGDFGELNHVTNKLTKTKKNYDVGLDIIGIENSVMDPVSLYSHH